MSSVEGMAGLRKRLKAIGKTPDELLDDWPVRAEEIAKKSHRPHKKTGDTERSIKGHRGRDEAVLEGGRGTVFLEFGTKQHWVRPRRGKVLAWAVDSSNRRLSGAARAGTPRSGMAFSRGHQVRGVTADPFMVPAGEKALAEFMDQGVVERLWNKAD